MDRMYTYEKLEEMNKKYPYNGDIKLPDKPDSCNPKYYLHFQTILGNFSRKQIALPVELKITEKIANKYNILWGCLTINRKTE